LLCLALLCPAYFLLQGAVMLAPELSLPARLVLLASGSLVLFALFPLAFVLWGRVRLVPAFGLHGSSWLAFLGALLLGVSLWLVLPQVMVLLRYLGVGQISPRVLAQASRLAQQWRELPSGVILISVALVPALAEELFFRGYLFRGLTTVCRPALA